MIAKEQGATPETARVTFTIPPYIWATEVHLVGDFNDWNRTSLPLRESAQRGWYITLDLPRGHHYQYRYLLDRAKWCNDCNADDYAPNPFGGDNSVVTV